MKISKWFKKPEPTPEELEAKQVAERERLEEYRKMCVEEGRTEDIREFEWRYTSTEEEFNKQIAEEPELHAPTKRIIEECIESLVDSLEYKYQSYVVDYKLDGPPHRFIARIGVYHPEAYPGEVKYIVCLYDALNHKRSIISSAVASLPGDLLYSNINPYYVRTIVNHTDILNVMLEGMFDDMLRVHGMDFRRLIG